MLSQHFEQPVRFVTYTGLKGSGCKESKNVYDMGKGCQRWMAEDDETTRFVCIPEREDARPETSYKSQGTR